MAFNSLLQECLNIRKLFVSAKYENEYIFIGTDQFPEMHLPLTQSGVLLLPRWRRLKSSYDLHLAIFVFNYFQLQHGTKGALERGIISEGPQ